MTNSISSIWRALAAGFKSRHQLLIENWSLRHQLQATQQSLLRLGLAQNVHISPANIPPPSADAVAAQRNACLRFLSRFSSEETRICLVLMLVAMVLVTANAFRTVRTFAPAKDTGNVWAELDSFSESGVAAAVLRRDAETLLIHYTDACNEHLQSLDAWKRNYAAWLANSGLADCAANSRRYEREDAKRPVFALDPWIARFKASLATLQARQTVEGLEHTLLLMYERDSRWPEFVDLYLEIVRKSPTDLDVVTWAEPVLRHANDLGRAEQVLTCLQFAAQHDPKHLLVRLEPILKRWSRPARTTPPLAYSVAVAPHLPM